MKKFSGIILLLVSLYFCMDRNEKHQIEQKTRYTDPRKGIRGDHVKKIAESNDEMLSPQSSELAQNAKEHSSLEDAPDFDTWFRLTKKAILSDDEKRLKQNLLCDPELIAIADLALRKEIPLRMKDDLLRIKAIDFLADAARWKNNPQRKYVFDTMEDIILEKDNLLQAKEMLSKKLIAGDKIELLLSLKQISPTRFRALSQEVLAQPNSPLTGLLNYALTRDKII